MKVRITSIEAASIEGVWNAKCSEITQDDILGRLVYVSFSKAKEVGVELELSDKRIMKVVTKKKRNILRYI